MALNLTSSPFSLTFMHCWNEVSPKLSVSLCAPLGDEGTCLGPVFNGSLFCGPVGDDGTLGNALSGALC